MGGVIRNFAKKSAEILPDSLKPIANSVISLNAIDFVKIAPKMGEKKVILIFDDLERANVSTGDLLGCINNYCENLHINTIVVANEEKIKSCESDKIKYDEIKEKIIQRTICYSPDYSSIVLSVINSMVEDKKYNSVSETYSFFLKTNKEIISDIFCGTSVNSMSLDPWIEKKHSEDSKENIKREIKTLLENKPHNIRSLKCAIQDFRRIYFLMNEKQINDKEKWLFTYLSYVLCFRAGLLSEKNKDEILTCDEKVSILYPGFYDDKYITRGIEQWIKHGYWEKDMLNAEFDDIMKKDKAIAPEEKVRMNRILDLEENDVRDGYPLFLEKAYDGAIELNDYVNLLYNSYWARTYDIEFPVIDWRKLAGGVQKQIEKILHDGEDQPHYRRIIGEDSREWFLPEEWDIYKIIDKFLSANTLMFTQNKNLYIDLIKKDPLTALFETRNKRFDLFDIEMAEATAEEFEKMPNAKKSSFINYFKGMWQSNICNPDYKIELSAEGFLILKERIEQFLKKCKDESLFIAAVHTNNFLEIINNLLLEQEQRVEEMNKKEENIE